MLVLGKGDSVESDAPAIDGVQTPAPVISSVQNLQISLVESLQATLSAGTIPSPEMKGVPIITASIL